MRGSSVSPGVLHCLVGELNSTALEFVLTDDLGSVRTAITTQAGAATVAGYIGYGPFGFVQYHAGQTGTNKGYTGQDTDPLSGLDYIDEHHWLSKALGKGIQRYALWLFAQD